MLVKKNIWSTRRRDLESPEKDHNEIIAVEIRPRPGHRLIALSAYRSQTDPSPSFLTNLEEVLINAERHDYYNFVILGDLNYSEINWIPDLDDNLPLHCRDLFAITERYNLTQLNYNPSTKDGNILDVVLTNLTNKFSPILSKT